MNKTNIEWCDYTINPVKGLCPVACSYCYARRMYKRFKWNPEIEFDWSVANDLGKMKPGSKVFWGSTMELFGDWVEPEWMRLIMEAVKRHSDLTHIFLTKRPENLIKWSPFPENCWVGVSLTGKEKASFAYPLVHLKASVKFLSIEPLLAPLSFGENNEGLTTLETAGINWLIIGQQTPVNQKTAPEYSWIEEIAEAADKARIPVFIKANLNACAIGDHPNLVDECGRLRQEYPVRDRRNQ